MRSHKFKINTKKDNYLFKSYLDNNYSLNKFIQNLNISNCLNANSLNIKKNYSLISIFDKKYLQKLRFNFYFWNFYFWKSFFYNCQKYNYIFLTTNNFKLIQIINCFINLYKKLKIIVTDCVNEFEIKLLDKQKKNISYFIFPHFNDFNCNLLNYKRSLLLSDYVVFDTNIKYNHLLFLLKFCANHNLNLMYLQRFWNFSHHKKIIKKCILKEFQNLNEKIVKFFN